MDPPDCEVTVRVGERTCGFEIFHTHDPDLDCNFKTVVPFSSFIFFLSFFFFLFLIFFFLPTTRTRHPRPLPTTHDIKLHLPLLTTEYFLFSYLFSH